MFETADGTPRWEKIYVQIKLLTVGEIAIYSELTEWAGVDLADSSKRGPLYKAIEVLQREDSRTLINVRGRGYRVAHASEHEGEALKLRQRALRQTGKARRKVSSANRNDLTPQERGRLDALEVGYSRVEGMLRGFERRELRLQNALKTVQESTDRTREEMQRVRRQTNADAALLQEKVESLEDRLARLEAASMGRSAVLLGTNVLSSN